MIYLKSFLAGLAALIIVAVVGVGVMLARVLMASREGIGVIAGPAWPIAAISLLAFAAGFFWQYRRNR